MMKERICRMISLAAAGLLLAGCTVEKMDDSAGLVPISLTTTVMEGGYTRAGINVQSTQLPSGETFYATFSGYNSTDELAGQVTVASATYTADGSGGVTTSPQPYFTLVGTSTTVRAYHGKADGTSSGDQVTDETTSFSVAADQSQTDAGAANYLASDLLYASLDLTKVNPTGALTFAHKMAKIIANVTIGTGITDIRAVKIIAGSRKIAIANPTTVDESTAAYLGSVSTDAADLNSAAGTSITMFDGSTTAYTSTTDPLSCAALLPPQTIGATEAAPFLLIQTAEGDITYSLSNKTLTSGNAYTLNITITANEINLTTEITDWNAVTPIAGMAGLTTPLTIASIVNQTYTGSAIEPVPVVTCNGSPVNPDNYDVFWVDNTAPGMAIAAVAGKEGTPYEGMYAVKEFRIVVPLGAFYFIDGTFGTTNPESKQIIGIVVYANEGRPNDDAITEKDEGYGHALVMALDNAGEYAWSLTQHDNTILPNVNSTATFAADFGGIAKTNALGDDTYNYPNYPAFYNAKHYEPAPSVTTNNSGWFLGSGGQWFAALGSNGLGADNVIDNLTWDEFESPATAQTMYENINNALTSAGGTIISPSVYKGYATSSEASSSNGTAFFFNYSGPKDVRIGTIGKGAANARVVRPFLAF